ncbi:MAG: hypothetical protein RLP02_35660 [Coleofasciculus sp. C2-GNP5-27]
MAEVLEIRKAFEVANQANMTREELEALEQREIYIHDQRNAIKLALRQGIQLGREQERQRTREAEQLAQQERQRAKLLEERLRSLGVDPDFL